MLPFTAFTTALLLFLPAAAMAANECGPGPVVECGITPYTNGITYTSAVDLSVTKTNTSVTTIGAGGINLTGTGNAAVNWNSAVGNVSGNATTSGPVIDALTQDGNISVTTAAVTGSAAGITHGIRARSTGTGDIAIVAIGGITGSNATSGDAAIFAQAAGGDISISNTSASTGRLYGIHAITSGDGDITIAAGILNTSTAAGVGIAAVRAVADTGAIRLDLNGNVGGNGLISTQGNGTTEINVSRVVGSIGGGAIGSWPANNHLSLINVAGAGDVTVNINGGSNFGTVFGGVDATANTGDVTINNLSGSGGWSFTEAAVKLSSGNDTINNQGLILAAAGAPVFENILRQSDTQFGGGVDRFNNSGTLVVGPTYFAFTQASTTQLDSFLGRYKPTENGFRVASQANFVGLEEFNNSGLIVLGAYTYIGGVGGFANADIPSALGPRFYTSDAPGEGYCRSALRGLGLAFPPTDGFLCTDSPVLADTDRLINSVLYMPGTVFTGSGGSAIKLDADFGKGLTQSNCTDRTGGAETWFRLPGADCVDLRGGATAGSTQIIVRDVLPGHQGAGNADGIVIVDVSGGTSAAEHFTLSPESDHYRETTGGRGVIDKGLFVFPLVYDADTQQHKLIGIPGASALQLPLLTHAAQSLARQTTASGLEERAQGVRSALRGGNAANGGFWGEFGQSTIERDLIQPMMAAGEALGFNNDYEQDSSTMMLGGDWLIAGGDKTAWLVGGSIGYVRSEVGFTESGNNSDLEGVILGAHGGYLTGNWFVNAGYSQSFLQVDDYVPAFKLSTDGSGASTNAQTQSVRVDGGRRFSITDALHVEPLASLAWIRADFDDLLIASPDNPLATSNRAKFGNAVSLRGALGARVGFDQAISALRLHYALTGRYWNEFDGKTDVRIASTGPEAALSDTFDGSFLDLAGRISLSDAEGHISGYVDATSVSGDDYSSLGFSAGFRYQW